MSGGGRLAGIGGACMYSSPNYQIWPVKLPIPVADKSIAAIPAESIPFIGVAVLIADTGYELYAACETVRDLDQLYSDLGMAEEAPGDVMHSVCDPELPEAGDVWNGVVEKSGEWLDQAREAM